MQFLSQSPFLQALGYAIANSLWQTALIWIAVVLLNSIKKTSSATRYSFAVAGQLNKLRLVFNQFAVLLFKMH